MFLAAPYSRGTRGADHRNGTLRKKGRSVTIRKNRHCRNCGILHPPQRYGIWLNCDLAHHATGTLKGTVSRPKRVHPRRARTPLCVTSAHAITLPPLRFGNSGGTARFW